MVRPRWSAFVASQSDSYSSGVVRVGGSQSWLPLTGIALGRRILGGSGLYPAGLQTGLRLGLPGQSAELVHVGVGGRVVRFWPPFGAADDAWLKEVEPFEVAQQVCLAAQGDRWRGRLVPLLRRS